MIRLDDATQIAGYVVLAIVVLRLGLHLRPWYLVHRVYGYTPLSLARQMLSYAAKSPTRWIVRSFFLVLLIWVILEILHWEPSVQFREPPRIIFLSVVLFFVDSVAILVLPPAVLYLSNSDRSNMERFALLSRKMWPYRVVALLRPREQWSNPDIRGWFFLGCLRTTNNYEWRTVVFHLMDVVPVIVIDLEAGAAGVQEEWARIQAKEYLDRTIQLRNPLAPPLISKIRKRLKNIRDHHERRHRQADFTAVLRTLPLHLRNDRSLYNIVIKSRWIGQQEYERYLRQCKGITPRQIRGLVEDIPSIVSSDEEEEFLRSSRAYEEVEILLKSALEAVRGSTDASSWYNVGNCLNNLGKLARDQHRWNDAICYLTQAIKHFGSLSVKSSSRDIVSGRQELATAYFFLGEVYMARFRRTGSLVDKHLAIEYLKRSLNLDKSCGNDASQTQQLLTDIHKNPTQQLSVSILNALENAQSERHLLREPRFWENPTVSRVLAILTAAVSFFLVAYIVGKLLDLPDGWFSRQGWTNLSWWQKSVVNLIAGAGAFIVSLFVFVVLTRRYWDK